MVDPSTKALVKCTPMIVSLSPFGLSTISAPSGTLHPYCVAFGTLAMVKYEIESESIKGHDFGSRNILAGPAGSLVVTVSDLAALIPQPKTACTLIAAAI